MTHSDISFDTADFPILDTVLGKCLYSREFLECDSFGFRPRTLLIVV